MRALGQGGCLQAYMLLGVDMPNCVWGVAVSAAKVWASVGRLGSWGQGRVSAAGAQLLGVDVPSCVLAIAVSAAEVWESVKERRR